MIVFTKLMKWGGGGEIAFLAILGTANVLVRTATYGPAVTTDSTVFLSTTLNILAGQGWRNFTGAPSVGWPPLFPLLLVAGGWVGIDPLEAGRWINAVGFGLIVLAAGCWLRSNLRSRWLVLAATATIATFLPLNDWASNFRTSTLFCLFTLLALIQLAAFLNRRTAASLWWAAGCTALAAVTRYPGVVLINIGVLMLLVRRTPPLAVQLKDAVVFGAVSSFPLAGVLTHNWAISETLTGRDAQSGQSLSAGLHQTAEVFREWVVPPNAPDEVAYLLWLVVATVGLASAAVIFRGRQPDPEAALAYFHLGPALPFGVFALAYVGFLVAIVPFTVSQAIDSRYLLPMHTPLLLAAVFLLDRFLSIEAAGWMATARNGLAALVLLGALTHVGFSARKNLRLTVQAQVAGYPPQAYNAAHWQHSETLKYLRHHHIEGRIFCNHAPLAWFADRRPGTGKYQDIPRDLPQEIQRIEVGAHIVWFQEFHNRAHAGYDLIDLRVLPGVETVAELTDGLVLRRTEDVHFAAERHRDQKQRYIDQLIQQAQTGERVVRARWDVYRNGRTLTYLKQPCAAADVQAKFILHVTPANPADLPAHRKRYDNLSFYFDQRGVSLADQCMAIAQLPDYPIGRIRVGQWIANEDRTVWEAEFAGASDGHPTRPPPRRPVRFEG